jgi:hypothetical protein
MSLELLEALDDARAFEATHRFEDLSTFHVPFDQLTGDRSTEASLKTIAERGGKVVLIGPTGAGKSSVIASVLGPLAEDLGEKIVPLRIPVAVANDETATEPGAFARHLLRTVIRYSTEILDKKEREVLSRSAADQVSVQGGQRVGRVTVGAPKLVADAGFAAEVKSGAEQLVNTPSAGESVEAVARLVEVFRSHGREPFFIIDDSDRWIRIGRTDYLVVADAFFVRVVSMLAREVGCGFVIAVHDEYLELESYRTAQQLLSQVIQLPTPADAAGAIQVILGRRIELAGISAHSEDLLEPAALELLAGRYTADRNLRRMLASVDRATQRACTDHVERLGPDLVQTALADLI